MMAAPAALQQQQCGTPAHPIDGLKNVLIWSSCRWISLDVSGHPSEGNSFWIKNLITQWTSMAFLGRQWSERVMGIEPTLEAWEAAVLPLNYTRIGVVPDPTARQRGRIIAKF